MGMKNTLHEKIVAIVEARMTSSRLPGKVLFPAAGKPLLGHLVDRLKMVPSVAEIVLATTINSADEPLVEFAREYGVTSFRGSEHDVMARVLEASEAVSADVIVSVTGDCPLVDPLIVEQVVQLFLINPCEYATNGHLHTFPEGMGVQVYKYETLKRSAAMTSDSGEREHVTLHIRRHPELFCHLYLPAPLDQYWPELHLSLDEVADYELLKKIIEHFNEVTPLFSCRDIVLLLKNRPEWVSINEHVVVKRFT